MMKVTDLVNSVIVIFFLITIALTVVSIGKIVTTSAPDFPSFYQSTIDLLHKTNPYTDKNIPNIFIYPPLTTIIYLPFIIFPYPIAQGTFIILSALTVSAIVYLSLKLLEKNFSWRQLLLFTSFAFLSFPTKFTLGMGQVNLIALFFLMLGYYLFITKRLFISSFFLCLAFIAKPILCFMLLFFITQKAGKTVGYLLIEGLIFLLFSILLYGIGTEFYYFQHIMPMLVNSTSGREVYYNQGMMGFVSRLTTDALVRKYLSFFLSAFLFGYTLYTMIRYNVQRTMQFIFFLTLLLLIHTLSWQHYFVFLIFPFIAAVMFIKEKKKYFLYIPLCIAYFFISWNFKNPALFTGFPEVLLLSHTFFGGIILLALLFDISRLSKIYK